VQDMDISLLNPNYLANRVQKFKAVCFDDEWFGCGHRFHSSAPVHLNLVSFQTFQKIIVQGSTGRRFHS
jgi:hypothetical protein